jgi:anti-sigma factor RsiW
MSCSPFDLRDYVWKELPDHERRTVELHVRECERCREDIERLRLTESALFALRDEEIPQRIGFVSDKVFSPSPLARWWTGFWNSTARLGFAAAAMLSVALLVSASRRPASITPAPAPAVDMARLGAGFRQRLDEAVAQAVAASEARQEHRTAELLAAAEKRHNLDRKALLLVFEENLEVMQKKLNRMYLASADMGAPQ